MCGIVTIIVFCDKATVLFSIEYIASHTLVLTTSDSRDIDTDKDHDKKRCNMDLILNGCTIFLLVVSVALNILLCLQNWQLRKRVHKFIDFTTQQIKSLSSKNLSMNKRLGSSDYVRRSQTQMRLSPDSTSLIASPYQPRASDKILMTTNTDETLKVKEHTLADVHHTSCSHVMVQTSSIWIILSKTNDFTEHYKIPRYRLFGRRTMLLCHHTYYMVWWVCTDCTIIMYINETWDK